MYQLEVDLLHEVPKVTRLPHLRNLAFSGLGKTSGIDARNDVTFMKRCKEQTSARSLCYCGGGSPDMIEVERELTVSSQELA